MNLPRSNMPGTGVRKTTLWGYLGFLGLALLFVGLRWNSYDTPLTRDEGEYAYSAWLLKQGVAPYQHAFLQKPPMIVYTYLLAELVAPQTSWFPRVLAGLFVGLTTLLIGAIARREFGPGSGMVAMWFVTPMVLLPRVEQYTANTEMFLILPLAGVVAVYVFARNQSQGRHWLAAGILAALSLLYKLTVLPLLLFLGVVWSYEEWKTKRSPGALLRRWLLCAAGGLLTSGVVLAFFLTTDGAQSLWDCVVRFNYYYSQSGLFTLAVAGFRFDSFWSAWWILFLLPLALIPKSPSRMWFWVALTVLAFAETYGSPDGHYYIPAMLFWALLTTAAASALVSSISMRFAAHRAWVKGAIVTILLVLICLPDASVLALTKEQFLARMYPFRQSTAIAQRLAEITSPNDYVLVAGSEPEILYQARRRSCTRFVLVYPLMMPTPLAERYQLEAIRDLQQRPPAAVVLALSQKSWLVRPSTPEEFQVYLAGMLRRDYELIGGYVAEDGGSFWRGPMSSPLVQRSTMLLFRLKSR